MYVGAGHSIWIHIGTEPSKSIHIGAQPSKSIHIGTEHSKSIHIRAQLADRRRVGRCGLATIAPDIPFVLSPRRARKRLPTGGSRDGQPGRRAASPIAPAEFEFVPRRDRGAADHIHSRFCAHPGSPRRCVQLHLLPRSLQSPFPRPSIVEAWSASTVSTFRGIQQQTVEETLLRQRIRAVRLAEHNQRALQRFPLWGSDLRALVSVYRRPTADVRANSRGWQDFTHALSALVPDFPAVCEREKANVENYTVRVAPARPMRPIRSTLGDLEANSRGWDAESRAAAVSFRRDYGNL